MVFFAGDVSINAPLQSPSILEKTFDTRTVGEPANGDVVKVAATVYTAKIKERKSRLALTGNFDFRLSCFVYLVNSGPKIRVRKSIV